MVKALIKQLRKLAGDKHLFDTTATCKTAEWKAADELERMDKEIKSKKGLNDHLVSENMELRKQLETLRYKEKEQSQSINELQAHVAVLKEPIIEFIVRVERGEIQGNHNYKKMCAAYDSTLRINLDAIKAKQGEISYLLGFAKGQDEYRKASLVDPSYFAKMHYEGILGVNV